MTGSNLYRAISVWSHIQRSQIVKVGNLIIMDENGWRDVKPAGISAETFHDINIV